MQTAKQRCSSPSRMTSCVRVLFGMLVLALLVYIILDCVNNKDTFGVWHSPCAGPCRTKGERDCCACAKCAWFVDDNYNGRCIRRGTGPDSCLMRTSHHNNYAWYSPHRWYYGNRRPIVHRGPGWVKDSWGRWIRASPARRGRHNRHRRRRSRQGGRRVGRRYHHL